MTHKINASRWRCLAFPNKTNPFFFIVSFCFFSFFYYYYWISIDRAYSSQYLIPRATSAVSLETPSSETASVDSNNRRHYSIPNGHAVHTLTVDRVATSTSLAVSPVTPQKETIKRIAGVYNNNNINNNNSSNNINNHQQTTINNNNNSIGVTSSSSSRRLSIKEPPDSIC